MSFRKSAHLVACEHVTEVALRGFEYFSHAQLPHVVRDTLEIVFDFEFWKRQNDRSASIPSQSIDRRRHIGGRHLHENVILNLRSFI